jgi:hypothetical protein
VGELLISQDLHYVQLKQLVDGFKPVHVVVKVFNDGSQAFRRLQLHLRCQSTGQADVLCLQFGSLASIHVCRR